MNIDTIFNKIDLISNNATGFVQNLMENNLKVADIVLLDLTNTVSRLESYMEFYLVENNIYVDNIIKDILDKIAKIFIEYYITEQLYYLINSDHPYIYNTPSMSMDIIDDISAKIELSNAKFRFLKTYFTNAVMYMLNQQTHDDMYELNKLIVITSKNDYSMPITWFNHTDTLVVGIFDINIETYRSDND